MAAPDSGSTALATTLAAWSPGDVSSRVLSGVFAILPFAARWRPHFDLAALAAEADPALADRIAARAEELAASPGARSALATFDFLDKSDTGIAVFSGLRGAVKVVRGQAGQALEVDAQQAADAGLKAIGIAWAAWKLFDGPLAPAAGRSAADRARALTTTPTGRALLTWFVAADLVLPFADNVASGGAAAVTGFLEGQAAEHATRLASVAGTDVSEAAGVLKQLLSTVQEGVGQVATYAGPLTTYAQQQLPSILGTVDKAAGLVATGVDTLSTYRLLGASLVAEVCVARATEEVRVLAQAEAEAAERARIEAERMAEERRAFDEAARQARALAEHQAREQRLRASAQQETYTLDEAVPAAALEASPIKVTRSSEPSPGALSPAGAAPAAKSGCFGCGGLLLIGVLAGAAAAVHALVA